MEPLERNSRHRPRPTAEAGPRRTARRAERRPARPRRRARGGNRARDRRRQSVRRRHDDRRPELGAESPPPDAAARAGRDLTVEQIYKHAAPGVVLITPTAAAAGQDPSASARGSSQALGSGFVIDKAGHIVTNYHVVAGRAGDPRAASERGVRSRPTVVGTDPSTDIAVLRVELPALRAHSAPARGLGQGRGRRLPSIAIGNPFGLDRTMTAGIVSAVHRDIKAPNGFTIDHVIQTDAAINHGNSGGPLLDRGGEVIGVNAQIQGGTVDGNVGVGFAIPVNTVKTVATQLIESGQGRARLPRE